MPESETSFGLIEPFDIDDGSLNAISRQECFCLGAEFMAFRQRLEKGSAFTDYFLADNAARLTKMAERAQRFVESRPAEKGWTLITVGGHCV
jgi:signal-transduction protein with cAMP-binding, CBS, and nucleotidyltransferase domain